MWHQKYNGWRMAISERVNNRVYQDQRRNGRRRNEISMKEEMKKAYL